MIRHLIIAALRNMAANKLISAISIFGLAIGIAAALLMALVVRNQTTFDEFLPGYERTYVVVTTGLALLGESSSGSTVSDSHEAELLHLNIPQIESVTRLGGGGAKLRAGQISARENIVWADANMFAVLPFPVLYGDPATALSRPDGVVLPLLVARKYFGRDNAVGQVIEIDGHPMIVRAVIKDIPENASRFENAPYVSGLAPFSLFAKDKQVKGRFEFGMDTIVRIKPGASVADAEKPIAALINTIAHDAVKGARLVRLDKAHLEVDTVPQDQEKLAIGIAVSLLTLFIAGANFVNLMVARTAQREREIGVRKACGAGRMSLAVQFLGEALVATLLAALIALALSEWMLPAANSYFNSGVTSNYWRDTMFIAVLPAGVAIIGLTAGAYPALVLSAFRPAGVLRKWSRTGHRGAIVRAALVMLQFAILMALIVGADAVYRQYNFVAREGLRVNIDQVLIVNNACNAPFRNGLRDIPGVKRFSCSGNEFLDGLIVNKLPYKGKDVSLAVARVDRGLFALYGQRPVAGVLTNPASGADTTAPPGLVINMAATRKLGFASPAAAVGQGIWQKAPFAGLKVVAVTPDFSLNNFDNKPILPTVFTSFDGGFRPSTENSILHIRLDGRSIPETLVAIDRLWKTTGGEGAIDRFFLDAHMQERYVSIFRQAQLFALFAAIAMFLACLGLFGIAISTAERRTKEIGVRKAMGAGDGQIVTLLLWQFAQPVLWANLIAWPMAWWLVHRWLTAFADHIDLQLWVFAAASLGALLIALLTVAGHAFLTARHKPVLALRYE